MIVRIYKIVCDGDACGKEATGCVTEEEAIFVAKKEGFIGWSPHTYTVQRSYVVLGHVQHYCSQCQINARSMS